jgi:hypothetical protein
VVWEARLVSLSQKPYQVRVAACVHGMASYMQVHAEYRRLVHAYAHAEIQNVACAYNVQRSLVHLDTECSLGQ